MTPALALADVATLPAACGWHEVAAVFGVGRSRFFKLEAEGAFDAFRLVPAIGPKRYSGALLRAYLEGQPAQLTRAREPKRMARASLRRVK